MLKGLSGHSKRRPKIGFRDRLSLNAGQGEHSAILMTFIKLPFGIMVFILSIFEWPLKTGFQDIPRWYFFCGSLVFFVSCVSHAFASVH